MKMRILLLSLAALAAVASSADSAQTFRLCDGVTVYVNNTEGKPFTITLDVRDLNLFANGPREVLCKVYDPDGRPVVRQFISDDGVTSPNFPVPIGGWDHEIQYYASLYASGSAPSFRWSAWSDPARLNTLVKRTFTHEMKDGKKGVYRIVLAGTPDHYVTLSLTPDLKCGFTGHPNFLHGHGDMLKKAFVLVPKGTTGIFFAATEPDLPRARRFKLTAPDGKVLIDQGTTGGYTATIGKNRADEAIKLAPGEYDGKLLTFEVSDGPGDYLVRLNFQQPKQGAFKDYTGMGSAAVFAPDAETARAIQGGTLVVDDLVFWQPFQVRFHNWLKAHPLAATDAEKALRTELESIFNGFRLLETSDGRGTEVWSNWAYGMGYYGFKVFRPSWVLMQRADVPQEVKDILREGLITAGDRLSFAVGMERVNGNAFSQINVALWYAQAATGDALLKERFEIFFDRWAKGGWGDGAGLSRSGDSQEHFAHDMHYGSYLLDNWRGGHWVKEGIMDDAKDDPRFQKILDRYRELYSYLYCRETNGTAVPANPWSARTHQSAHAGTNNWELAGHKWKGEPGPDFTVNVNDGNEWFAARRKNYYLLTFHGRLAPQWMNECFKGPLGFGGGILCQLTVPGKGPVLASTLHESYGEGMDPSLWPNYHLHTLIAERWDNRPVVAALSEHPDARLDGNTIASSGEVRDGHVKVTRRYTCQPDGIDCEVALAESDYGRVLSIWMPGRRWSEMKSAWEMIPFLKLGADKQPTRVTLKGEAGADLGAATTNLVSAAAIRIDRGGFGVEVQLEQSRPVRLGNKDTILIQVVGGSTNLTTAADIQLKYRLVPFRTD